jgi:hydroxyquinol 1,2-dioxygenase
MRNFNENTITDAPDGRMVDGDYFQLNYDFGLKQVASSAQAA